MESSEKYEFDRSEALVESMLGRQLIPDGEHALMDAVRQWLSENGSPGSRLHEDAVANWCQQLAVRFRVGRSAGAPARRPPG